jgi:hypothetical protein
MASMSDAKGGLAEAKPPFVFEVDFSAPLWTEKVEVEKKGELGPA